MTDFQTAKARVEYEATWLTALSAWSRREPSELYAGLAHIAAMMLLAIEAA